MAKKAAKKAVRKTAAKKVVKRTAQPTRPAKKAVPKAPRAKAAAAPKKKVVPVRKAAAGESLGRPLITAEEKLYLLFKEDYHARQIFEFLRVGTVGELEQFAPQQIIEILSTPLRTTVERIRERLAEHKRHLRDDLEFARRFLDARDSP